MDDTFVNQPLGQNRMRDFLDHLNSVHQNIQFTMETGRDGHLPFLDIDIYRRPDGSLGHKVYCKPMGTDKLSCSSLLHPT
jgi:hypothetical protein